MRVLFVGGKDVGCGCLEKLISHPNVVVVGAIINRKGDLSQDRWYRSVAEIALTHHIPLYKASSINDSECVKFVRSVQPDLMTVVYYDQLLKQEVIDIPVKGCINVHMALAEEYRGCFPTTWALMNDENYTGVTIHFVNEGMDTGDIIRQCHIKIADDDTGRTLYYKCTSAAIDLFQSVIQDFVNGQVISRSQRTTKSTKTYHRKDFPDFDLCLKERDRELYNKIRALTFDPFPCPYFYIGTKKMLVIEETRLRKYGEEEWM